VNAFFCKKKEVAARKSYGGIEFDFSICVNA